MYSSLWSSDDVYQSVGAAKVGSHYGKCIDIQLDSFENYDLSSLRTGIMAGSVCPIDTMKQVMQRMNMEQITIGYGMTETSPIRYLWP